MASYQDGPLDFDNISAFLSSVNVIRDELIGACVDNDLWDGYSRSECRVSEISAHILAGTYYTVTFDANGGSCQMAKKLVKKGGPVGVLPDATLDGNVHIGWFTAASGGTQVNTATIVNSDITVYAQYMKSVMTLVKVGSVTVDDNMMASGFSNTSYLTSITGDNLNFADGLELVFRAYTANSAPNQEIFGMTGADAFEFGAINGQFMWEIALGSVTGSGTPCTNNKWYYWKVIKETGVYVYNCYYADGTSITDTPAYTLDCTATRTATVNDTFAIGIDYWCMGPYTRGEPWQGVIDLKNSYIKVNGKKIGFRIAT